MLLNARARSPALGQATRTVAEGTPCCEAVEATAQGRFIAASGGARSQPLGQATTYGRRGNFVAAKQWSAQPAPGAKRPRRSLRELRAAKRSKRPRAAAEVHRPTIPLKTRWFNPLPPPKRRETAHAAWFARECKEFQSTPPPRRRETGADRELTGGQGVSIHSAHRSGRRRSVMPPPDTKELFQSTPPAEAEGDTRPWKAGFDKSLASGFREPCDGSAPCADEIGHQTRPTSVPSATSAQPRKGGRSRSTEPSRLTRGALPAGPRSPSHHGARSALPTPRQGCRSAGCPS